MSFAAHDHFDYSCRNGSLAFPGKTGDRRNVPRLFEGIEIGERPIRNVPQFFDEGDTYVV